MTDPVELQRYIPSLPIGSAELDSPAEQISSISDRIFTLAAKSNGSGYGAVAYAGAGIIHQTQIAMDNAQKVARLCAAIRETLNGTAPEIEFSKPVISDPPPSHWEKQNMIAGGRNATYWRMFVPDAKETIFLAMGHGTKSQFYKPWIERINNLGFNVVTFELTEPENIEFFEDGTPIHLGYEDMVSDAFLDPNSPLFEHVPDDHDTFLVTHSSSGQGFEKAISRCEEKAGFAREKWDGRIFHTGLMLDTANSSYRHHRLLSELYTLFATHPYVHDIPLGGTEADKVFIKDFLGLSQEEYMMCIQDNPTHGQSAFLKHSGMEHMRFVEQNDHMGENFRKLRRTVLMGEHESSACPLTAKDYDSCVEGVSTQVLKGAKHNVIMECAEAYSIIARSITSHLRLKLQVKELQAATAALPVREPQAF